MKNHDLKAFAVTLIASLLPFSALTQLRTPENVPINFYGKVIDQQGQPVVGAKVSFDLLTSHIRQIRTSEKPMTLETGADGRFSLTGVTGYAIDQISIAKEGYELSQKAPRGFTFGLLPDYTPDTTNPVVFKMWKQTGKETLTHSSWRGKAVCDGTTNCFDLLSGHSQADGNLKIACFRIPVNLPPANTKPYTYKFQISLNGGGIQPTDDDFTFLAPEQDYLQSLTYGQSADDPKWDRRTPIPKEYYIKTADGHYGHLSVDWDVAFWKAPMILKWNCSINPSGSRNLER